MPQAEHLQAFVNLGELFTRFYENPNDTFNGWRPQLEIVIEQAEVHNPWYTKENIAFCLLHWGPTDIPTMNIKLPLSWQEIFP